MIELSYYFLAVEKKVRTYKHLCYLPSPVGSNKCKQFLSERERKKVKRKTKGKTGWMSFVWHTHINESGAVLLRSLWWLLWICAFVDNISDWLTCDVSALSQIWNTSSMMEHSLLPSLTKQKEKNWRRPEGRTSLELCGWKCLQWDVSALDILSWEVGICRGAANGRRSLKCYRPFHQVCLSVNSSENLSSW